MIWVGGYFAVGKFFMVYRLFFFVLSVGCTSCLEGIIVTGKQIGRAHV